jgi:hypothetical protein
MPQTAQAAELKTALAVERTEKQKEPPPVAGESAPALEMELPFAVRA